MYYTNKSTITILESCFQIVYMANTIVVLRGVIILFKNDQKCLIKSCSIKLKIQTYLIWK